MSIYTKTRTIFKIARANPKGWQSYVWNTGMAQMRQPWPLLPPVYLAIEPTNACNAKCPVCETGKNEMARTKGMLDIDVYRDFISKVAPTTNTVMLYFMGETFLHKNVYEMIRLTRDQDIYVETCTNGDFVDPKGVIYSDINKISFQIGGMTEETHQRYRVGTSLAKSQAKLIELIEERRKHPDSNVQIEVGFIVMRHNEHEVEAFLKWAEEIGVDIANIVDPCVRNMLEAFAYLPQNRKYWYYDDKAFDDGVLKPKVLPDNECAWLWNSMQINWNGDAVPCCRDPNGKHILGNVFEDGVMKVFNGKKARDFRKKVLTDQGNIDICKLCSGYGLPTMQKENPVNFSVVHHTTTPEEARDIEEIAKQAVDR